MLDPKDIILESTSMFFRLLVKKAFPGAVFKRLKVIQNICDTGVWNIIGNDGHYDFDLYTTTRDISPNEKDVPVFEVSKYSQFSTYATSKVYRKDTLEEIKIG